MADALRKTRVLGGRDPPELCVLTDRPVAGAPGDASYVCMFNTGIELAKLLQLQDKELKSLLRVLRKKGLVAQA
jgi:hypothetical protein